MTIPAPEPRGYPGNLGLLLSEHAGVDRTALVDLHDAGTPREISYGALDALCDAVARGLVRRGLKAGDRVAIISLNRHEFVATLLGAMRAGVVPVPINIKLAPDAVRYIVEDAGAKLVLAEAALRRLCPEGVDVVELESLEGFLDRGTFTAIEPAADTVAIQPYTSGSTGRPKGVLLTHFGQNWSRRILAHTRGTTPADVIIVAAPLYHKNALNAIKQGLTAGAKLVLMPQFNVERYVAAIGEYGATVISGVPTMMSMVLARRDLLARTDTSTVRTIMMGSAPSSPQLIAQLNETFPNAQPLVVYGVTEGGPVPLGPHSGGLPRPMGSIGAPYEGTEAALIDASGARVEGAGEGELVLRNPGVLIGYHNLPDETAKRVRDGWYHTGDICRRDAQGFYYFVGRTDDMFVCGGENIFPIEVEQLLERHPSVHQAYVLPFEHELKGHVPYAFVVLRKNASASEDELKQFALANGPAYEHPRRVFFVNQLPLAGTNKIDQKQLRRWVADGTLDSDRKKETT